MSFSAVYFVLKLILIGKCVIIDGQRDRKSILVCVESGGGLESMLRSIPVISGWPAETWLTVIHISYL